MSDRSPAYTHKMSNIFTTYLQIFESPDLQITNNHKTEFQFSRSPDLHTDSHHLRPHFMEKQIGILLATGISSPGISSLSISCYLYLVPPVILLSVSFAIGSFWYRSVLLSISFAIGILLLSVFFKMSNFCNLCFLRSVSFVSVSFALGLFCSRYVLLSVYFALCNFCYRYLLLSVSFVIFQTRRMFLITPQQKMSSPACVRTTQPSL